MKPKIETKYQYSYSRISDYNTCPFTFKVKYLDKKPVVRNPLMKEGAVVHDAIRMYNLSCIKGKTTHDMKVWQECIDEAIKKENLPYEGIDGAFELMKQYVDTHELHPDKIVGVEDRIVIMRDLSARIVYTMDEWMDKDILFRMKVDLMEKDGQVVRITDYKTGNKIGVDKLQFDVYAWGISKLFPDVTTYDINMDYVRHEFNSNYKIDIDDISKIEKKILLKISEIEKDRKFSPQIGDGCACCGCWAYCKAIKEMGDVPKVPSNESEAVKLAEELEKVEVRKKEISQLLQAYCDIAGNVPIGSKVYGFTPTKTLKVKDMRKFIDEFQAIGGDITEIVNIDSRKLKKIYSPQLQEIVEKFCEYKTATRFGKKKAPKDDEKQEEA